MCIQIYASTGIRRIIVFTFIIRHDTLHEIFDKELRPETVEIFQLRTVE